MMPLTMAAANEINYIKKGKAEESLERVEEIYNQTGKYAMTVY